MLAKKIEKALNQQLVEEFFSSNLYLSMASWCDVNALPGAAAFLYKHADEEREHYMKLFKYINEAGGQALVDAIREPKQQFKSLLEIFTMTLTHEQHITQCVHDLITLCTQEKDYTTLNFLQWFVAEQHEEEKLFKSILDIVKMAGNEGRGLILADKQIAKMATAS